MKRERLILLLGLLVASVFFYLGLNEWLKSKEEKITPPPVVVKPQPPTEKVGETPTTPEKKEQQEKTQPVIEQPPTEKGAKTPTPTEKQLTEMKGQKEKTQTPIVKQKTEEKPKEDIIAQRIREEKKKEALKEKPKKTYIVQVGAFSVKENAQKALKKAESLGYKGSIIEEDGLYKVRVKVITSDLRKDISKLKSHFGGVILIKQKDV